MRAAPTLYVCSLANAGEPGEPKELFTSDPVLAQQFADSEDKRPNRGVFDCLNLLTPGARRRSLETVHEMRFIYFDEDLQHIAESREQVITKLRALPVEFTSVRDGGSGNLHLVIEIKDPPQRGTPEYDRLLAVWKNLAVKFAADPAPVHPAALIRREGTHNKKNGGNGLCHPLWNGGSPLDVTELEELDDLLTEPLLTRKPASAEGAKAADNEENTPVDVGAELGAMTDGKSVNAVHTRIIPSLLRKGEHPDDVLEFVVNETMTRVGAALNWSRTEEIRIVVRRIISAYKNLLLRDYDPTTGVVPEWLPGEFHARWIAVLEEGRQPDIGFNPGGFYVRSYGPKINDAASGGTQKTQDGAKSRKSGERRVLVLQPFTPFDVSKLPPRSWLYGKHYQRRTVSLTAGPGGMGKTSNDMVEAIAMVTGRNLLGEQPEERLRVWFHNGEDPRDEIDRRLAAICQHFKIPQEELTGWLWTTSGNEFPLRVAKGYANFEVNAVLVRQISAAISDNQIDLAIFDPLVTLHSVSEIDTGKMDGVIRLFAGIADETDAAIELAHHVRKPAAGSAADYDVHDIRGVAAITDAVRAARVLNRMNERDAEAAGCSEIERLSRFRVDRAKGNYSPAQVATWRQFINIELPNGDDVGVVAPWNFPGQGEQTPEKAAADQKAEHVFLQLLDKFTARGANVSANSGPTYAPAKFAEEREAKTARVSKAALKAAMNRLLDSGRIRTEPFGRDSRNSRRLVRGQGTQEAQP
jgi:RecA-family ATPase